MSGSVTASLLEKYGIVARPGEKIECPFCHHQTFSIKRDDTVGKCFHPTCGRFVTPWQSKDDGRSVIFQILEDIYHDFHEELLRLSNANHQNAYRFCLDDRRIHPRVITDSMLGAVPSGYEPAKHFDPYIKEAEKAVDAEQKIKGKPGRPPAKTGPTAQEKLDSLIKAKEKFSNCVLGNAGWLAFFYTDAAHRIVSARFRKPYTKQIFYFKPTKITGVFNHGLFTPCETPDLRDLNDLLLVVEGEFNQLQLQSLCARYAEERGKSPESGYIYSCAVGGVDNTDSETIRRLARNPIVCYDNDADDAGLTLVNNLRKATTVTAFTTPDPDSDLDDFIRGFGADTAGAFQALKKLISKRKLFNRPYDAIKSEIDDIRRLEGFKHGLKGFEVIRRTVEIIIADFKERGRFYHDGRIGYFFLNVEKQLLSIEPDNQNLGLILSYYGILPSEPLHKHLLCALGLEALDHGTETQVCLFTHYDTKTGILYLYDFGHRVYRITTENIDHVDNGTDGVLFLHNPACKPFKRIDTDPKRSGLHELIIAPIRFRDDRIRADERRLLLLIWILSLFFPELFPTKPILALIGPTGSIKTFILKMVGKLFLGPSFNVMVLTHDPKDFDAAVTHEHFVAIDNADTEIPWFEDRLAIAATGGSSKRRDLYTTNRLVEFPYKAFLGITSRTPHFKREDVANRTILLYVDRFDKFIPEAKLLAQLEEKRDEIMSEVVGYLQEIVKALQDQAGKTYSSRFRIADFGDFALKWANFQGWGEKMESILNRLAQEQSSFALEGEPIFQLLEIWLYQTGTMNVGRKVTTSELCLEISDIAKRRGIKFESAGNTKSFAQRLGNLMSTLEEHFDIQEHQGRGRTRYLSFWPKDHVRE